MFGKRLGESRSHVHGDSCNLGGSIRTELVEEAIEATGAFALCPVDDIAPVVVGDQSNVVALLSIENLIHTYQKQILQGFGLELFSYHPLTNHAYCSRAKDHGEFPDSITEIP